MADKLATAFQNTPTPPVTEGMLLFNPTTGERERLTIDEFFQRFGIIPIAGGAPSIPEMEGDTAINGRVTLPISTAVRFEDELASIMCTISSQLSNVMRFQNSKGGGSFVFLGTGDALFTINNSNGQVTADNLKGTGTRNVVVDENGVLSAP